MKTMLLAVVAFIGLSSATMNQPETISSKPTRALFLDNYAWDLTLLQDGKATGMGFEDEIVKIDFEPTNFLKRLRGPESMGFWITNKTNAPIKLIWCESNITSLNGEVRKLWSANGMNAVSFDDCPQESSIHPGKRYGDGFVPQSCIWTRENSGHYDDFGNWHDAWTEVTDWSLFNGDDFSFDYNLAEMNQYVAGKTFSMKMVFQVGGQNKVYDFTFKVEQIKKQGMLAK